jgi:hypothetical protein
MPSSGRLHEVSIVVGSTSVPVVVSDAVDLHVRRSNPVPAANRFHMDFLTKNSCYENTVLFAQYSTLIQIKLQ